MIYKGLMCRMGVANDYAVFIARKILIGVMCFNIFIIYIHYTQYGYVTAALQYTVFMYCRTKNAVCQRKAPC